MRASFRLDKDVLVITLDEICERDRHKTTNLELALLAAYGHDRSAYWSWRGNEDEGMNKCVITRPRSNESDVANAQEVLADFCV